MFPVLLMFLGIFFKEANLVMTGNPSEFAVRLNNSFGNISNEGRLEIYHSGTWETVCDELFTNKSANVACVSLGFSYGEVIGNRYGAGNGSKCFDNVNCAGNERSIQQCSHHECDIHNCSHSKDVSVRCEGISTKPSNAFPRTDKDDPVIFNCTSTTKYLPSWTIYSKYCGNITITNSSCEVNTSACNCSWFRTETLGPGSCNLIVNASWSKLNLLAGILVCTDSTLASAGALMVPINIGLHVTKSMDSSSTITDIVRDEEIKISCIPSFIDLNSSPSLVFTYFIYSGGPVVQIRISRIYWTSQGVVVPSTTTLVSSSYVLVKAPAGVIPPYKCNIVCDFFSNISDISGSYSIEISESTKPIKVLFWPTKENMKIIGDDNGQILSTGLLFCNAPANPPATYQWIDESTGNKTDSQAITIIHGGKYTCNASNSIRGRYYQGSKSIDVALLEDGIYRLKALAIALGVLLAAAVLLIVIIRACCHRKANTTADVGHAKQADEQKLQQKAISNSYTTGVAISADDAVKDYET